jgi:GNAT superfamily N-acetyltransferase
MMPLVRRIRPTDAPSLREVRLRALWSDADAFGSSYEREVDRPSHAWDTRARESSLGSHQCVFVAETQSGFVGMAGAHTGDEEPFVRHVYGMWVAPEARLIGVGTRLVEEIIQWATEAATQELQLWVVDGNQPARRLFERTGFVPTGHAQPSPSNPSLTQTLMRLPLDSAPTPIS